MATCESVKSEERRAVRPASVVLGNGSQVEGRGIEDTKLHPVAGACWVEGAGIRQQVVDGAVWKGPFVQNRLQLD